ncbi:MAG: alcohol dehydrogenase catalytic domain-containing protein, partial [Chloroflexales bacterium]|nr:alcohol dehydrogenase catalytic domain-containing protein [Chloroflexales bacterium]
MKAVRIHEYGGPEVLRYEEAPEPKPGPFELLVRVGAAGLNRADLALRQGQYLSQARFPQTLGFEVAGEVMAIGSRVPTDGPGGFALGQHVCGTAAGGYA